MTFRHLLRRAMRPCLPAACALAAACAVVAAAEPATVTATSAPAPPPAPYALPDTESWTLHAQRLQRDYELVVALPKGYAQSTRRYPVVFVTDAGYGVPLLAAIERHVAGHGRELAPFIVVGLGYAKGETPEYSRRRDYTPTTRGDTDAVSDMPGRPVLFGQAEAYRLFVRDEVFPFIAAHYRADMAHKLIAGQSYGALFAAHVLLAEPAMFETYLIGSPSLWFDHWVMLQRERDYAAVHRALKAQVFLGVGAYEAARPGSRNPRYNRDTNMVADLQAFAAALRGHHYAGLSLVSQVYPDEDHLTLPPLFFTRGLLWALGSPQTRGP